VTAKNINFLHSLERELKVETHFFFRNNPHKIQVKNLFVYRHLSGSSLVVNRWFQEMANIL
jgi:hypothetical protein